MQSREALYIWRARYISFTIAAGGFRPALPLGNARSPNSCGRLSLNSPTRPPTKLQRENQARVLPAWKKRKKKKKGIGVIPYGVQGLAPSRGTGDAESLNHQIGNISIYCVVFASISAVVGTFYPSPREVWDSGWGLLVSSALGGDRIVYLSKHTKRIQNFI